MKRLRQLMSTAGSKLRLAGSCTLELRELSEALKEACATDRMGQDEEFCKFITEELAPALMSRLAKITSFDKNVSHDHNAV